MKDCMKHCFTKRCLISFVLLFLFLFIYDKMFHGSAWMMDLYSQTASLWRPEDAMKDVAPWFFARYALLAAVICCLYKKTVVADSAACAVPGEKAPVSPYPMGLCFGVSIGVLMGVMQASSYIWMPISGTLAMAWFLGSLVQGILAGMLLTFIYHRKGGKDA